MNKRIKIAELNRLLPLLLLATAVMLGGCSNMPGQPEVIEVKARYLDLENRTVAVVVSTSDYIDFNFPDAREGITTEISRRIQVNVPGVQVTNPADIIMWQQDNEYWDTRPPSAIIEQLEVDRLVLVEIGEYRTHEPGDKYILRGVISATVNVVEAEASDPDTFGGSYSKSVMYPRSKDSWIGEAATSEKKVEAQAQYRFCEETAGLFYDHELVR
jgi:hypothetical protein